MTLTLIVTCALIGTWDVPPGWTVKKIDAPGCSGAGIALTVPDRGAYYTTPPTTRVTLERPVQPREKVALPPGCQEPGVVAP